MPGEPPQIDAHHHLWRYNPVEFGWITEPMASLRRDFLVSDLADALRSSAVTAAVAVQARESIEETDWLLECAGSTDIIAGVVGWAPLASSQIGSILDRYVDAVKLVGFREVAQGQPEGYFDRSGLNRGVAQLAERDLAYDVLIYENQLPEAIRFVDRHPKQRFVLDHAAKPRIAAGEMEPWATNLRELARRENISCKVSGLVTEADWKNWNEATLRPYLDTCVEAFGTDRLLAGSDWPVCLVASTHSRWWNLLRDYFSSFSSSEQRQIFWDNAIRSYKLKM